MLQSTRGSGVDFVRFELIFELQEGNGVLDPESDNGPTSDVVNKTVEYFYYKVVEKGCDPGAVVKTFVTAIV